SRFLSLVMAAPRQQPLFPASSASDAPLSPPQDIPYAVPGDPPGPAEGVSASVPPLPQPDIQPGPGAGDAEPPGSFRGRLFAERRRAGGATLSRRGDAHAPSSTACLAASRVRAGAASSSVSTQESLCLFPVSAGRRDPASAGGVVNPLPAPKDRVADDNAP